jgi:hypothetical protein
MDTTLAAPWYAAVQDKPPMKSSAKPNLTKTSPKQAKKDLLAATRAQRQAAALPPDPLSLQALRPLALRIGIPLVVLWIVALFLNGWIPKAILGVLTLALAGVAFWALRYAGRSRRVAELVRDVGDSPEARKEALEKLETGFKKDDTAAVFAKAQLQMQENPREALKTLESIKLDRVMAPIADQARAQRGMIHLMLGDTEEARLLIDGIDLSRHKDAQTRATLGAIMGESFARSGQAQKAIALLDAFDLNDAVYKDLLPQLLRAKAFAYAWASNTKLMKQTLRRLAQINPQFLMGFITKKKNPMGVSARGVHPMLEKEAFDMVMRSGLVPRKMEMRRG